MDGQTETSEILAQLKLRKPKTKVFHIIPGEWLVFFSLLWNKVFHPPTINQWNDFNVNIRNSESCSVFKNSILHFIRPSENSFHNFHYPEVIKLLRRLCLNANHLPSEKYKHSFQDSLNLLCTCGLLEELASHFLLHCTLFAIERSVFLNKVRKIYSNLLTCNDSV